MDVLKRLGVELSACFECGTQFNIHRKPTYHVIHIIEGEPMSNEECDRDFCSAKCSCAFVNRKPRSDTNHFTAIMENEDGRFSTVACGKETS